MDDWKGVGEKFMDNEPESIRDGKGIRVKGIFHLHFGLTEGQLLFLSLF